MARPHLFCATRQIEFFASSLGYSDVVYLLLLAAARTAVRRHQPLKGWLDRCLRAKSRAEVIEDASELGGAE